jgi:hypothetical protein
MKGDTTMIIFDKDGIPRHKPDDYVLQEGEELFFRRSTLPDGTLPDGGSIRRPLYLMDGSGERHATSHQSPEKRYAWDGNTSFQLHRPGFRPRTLLRDAATTADVEALDAAKALNDGYAKLREQRAQQAAEIKKMFDELQYQRR